MKIPIIGKKEEHKETDRGWKSVRNEGESNTQTENGPGACSAHSCPLVEWGSNRAFICLQHKDSANVHKLKLTH